MAAFKRDGRDLCNGFDAFGIPNELGARAAGESFDPYVARQIFRISRQAHRSNHTKPARNGGGHGRMQASDVSGPKDILGPNGPPIVTHRRVCRRLPNRLGDRLALKSLGGSNTSKTTISDMGPRGRVSRIARPMGVFCAQNARRFDSWQPTIGKSIRIRLS